MTATEKLRKLLDERGMEYETEDRPTIRYTEWGDWVFSEPLDAKPHTLGAQCELMRIPAAPEQAIAATLGRGTCKVESMHGYTDAFTHTSYCVELSCHTLDAWEDSIPPSYCPICGRKVMDE